MKLFPVISTEVKIARIKFGGKSKKKKKDKVRFCSWRFETTPLFFSNSTNSIHLSPAASPRAPALGRPRQRARALPVPVPAEGGRGSPPPPPRDGAAVARSRRPGRLVPAGGGCREAGTSAPRSACRNRRVTYTLYVISRGWVLTIGVAYRDLGFKLPGQPELCPWPCLGTSQLRESDCPGWISFPAQQSTGLGRGLWLLL